MSTISLPNTFSNGQTADASQVNSNFTTIYNDYNGGISNINLASNAALAATKLNLTTIAQTIAMSSNPINWAKGADIASATTTDIGAATGNVVDVTGTVTITGLGTVQSGTFRIVRFTGALTLTYNATSLILPGSASITTANGDCAGFESLGSGNWKCVFYQKQDGTPVTGSTTSGSTIQHVVTSTTATTSLGTTALPKDNTVPQNTEGNAISALDTAITPGNASNKLLVIGSVSYGVNAGTTTQALSLFQDATLSAIRTISLTSDSGSSPAYMILIHEMTAGTTSSTTFKLRIGNAAGSSTILNSGGDGTNYYGATSVSQLQIFEIKA